MMHKLKLREEFADAVLSGEKRFEIRLNDRGYQNGDLVEFTVKNEYGIVIDHPLNGKKFRITYILSGWGLKEGYVVFSITDKLH